MGHDAESKQFYIVYRCSNCDNLNLGRISVKEKRISRIIDEYKRGVYRAAELNFLCEKCGHKEAWSRMRYSEIEKRLTVPFLAAGILAVLCFLKKSFLASAVISLGIGVWFVIKHFHRTYIEKCIAKLPKHSVPILTSNKNELIYLMKIQQAEYNQE